MPLLESYGRAGLDMASKKKILYISHSSRMGGAEKCLLLLLKSLNTVRFTPIVVLPTDGELKSEMDRMGMDTRIMPLSWWISSGLEQGMYPVSLEERCRRIVSVIEEEGIDIVQTNTSVIAEGAIAARLTRRPHIWHLHEIIKGDPDLRPIMPLYFTYKFVDLLSDAVIVVSQVQKTSLIGKIRSDSISVIYNAIEPFEAIKGTKDLRRELNLPRETLLVCTIGKVSKAKGTMTFVRAAEQVLEKRKDVHFIAIGENDYPIFREDIKRRLDGGCISGHISFLGFRNDVRRILEEVDVYVVASETEAFNLAAVEAMAAGKPVVTTRCGGPEEIVVDGRTGFHVPLTDPGAMAGCISVLLDDPEKRRAMGSAGKERFEALFKAARYSSRFEDLYSRLATRRLLSEEDEELADALTELIDYKSFLLEAREKRISDLLNSWSWKVTAPLRKAANMLKGSD
jgi:glycosyltransferase involved in cell wall biosynthesis